MFSKYLLTFSLLTSLLVANCGPITSDTSDTSGDEDSVAGTITWIDTHTHYIGVDTECITSSCLDNTLSLMGNYSLQAAFVMHPPAPASGDNLSSELSAADTLESYPDQLIFMGGGGSLNALIGQAVNQGQVTSALETEFDTTVTDLIAAGATAFGEMAATHLSYGENHAFEENPPNHELFLRLADAAAENNIPIDLHMDLVTEDDMTTPDFFADASPNNPATLEENLTGLETLLDHNTQAKIVWAHVGRNTTNVMTVDLLRDLLEDHDNLYFQLAIRFPGSNIDFIAIDDSGNIESDWLDMMQDFPDRFVLGTDAFFADDSNKVEALFSDMDFFFDQLSEDLAKKVGCENVVTIYNLDVTCP